MKNIPSLLIKYPLLSTPPTIKPTCGVHPLSTNIPPPLYSVHQSTRIKEIVLLKYKTDAYITF